MNPPKTKGLRFKGHTGMFRYFSNGLPPCSFTMPHVELNLNFFFLKTSQSVDVRETQGKYFCWTFQTHIQSKAFARLVSGVPGVSNQSAVPGFELVFTEPPVMPFTEVLSLGDEAGSPLGRQLPSRPGWKQLKFISIRWPSGCLWDMSSGGLIPGPSGEEKPQSQRAPDARRKHRQGRPIA